MIPKATVRYRCASSELRYALTRLRLILQRRAPLSADGLGKPPIWALPIFSLLNVFTAQSIEHILASDNWGQSRPPGSLATPTEERSRQRGILEILGASPHGGNLDLQALSCYRRTIGSL